MKKINKILTMNKKVIAVVIFGVLALSLVFSGTTQAQTSGLPDPGRLPNGSFYFVKSFFEGVGTFFTLGNSAKAERYLALAERRLAEARELAEQGNERAQEAVVRYEEQFTAAQEKTARTNNADLELRVTDMTTKHIFVLDKVLALVPEQAKESIRAAQERSVVRQIEALRDIAKRDPESAVYIFVHAAEGRLNAAQVRAGKITEAKVIIGHLSDEEAKGVKEALEDYDKYAQFGQEISTTVEDLLKQVTSHHLQVLEDINQELPPQAQQEFQRALDSARKVQQDNSVGVQEFENETGGYPQKTMPVTPGRL